MQVAANLQQLQEETKTLCFVPHSVAVFIPPLTPAVNRGTRRLQPMRNAKQNRYVSDISISRKVPEIESISSLMVATANCIIIDHFSAFESGLVAPFLYAA
jgi:hypothetical protein